MVVETVGFEGVPGLVTCLGYSHSGQWSQYPCWS